MSPGFKKVGKKLDGAEKQEPLSPVSSVSKAVQLVKGPVSTARPGFGGTQQKAVDRRNMVRDTGKISVGLALADRPNLLAYLQARNWSGDETDLDESEGRIEYGIHFRQMLRMKVDAQAFDTVVGIMIVLNAIVMALDLEHEGHTSAESLGLSPDTNDWPAADQTFAVFRHVFTIFFLLELLIRLSALGKEYFHSAFNCMDFLIVAFSILEMYIFVLLDVDFPNVSFLRLIRLAKLARILRIVRVFEIFYQLRVLLTAVSNMFGVLSWSMVFLFIVQFIAAIFMTQILQPFLRDDGSDPEVRMLAYWHFGTFIRSFLTMFEITLAPGAWDKSGRTMIYEVSQLYMLFFLGYLILVTFALIRTIGAIFLKETLEGAARDTDKRIAHTYRDPKYVRKLWKVFEGLDKDKKGFITLEQLCAILEDDDMYKDFKSLGIQFHEMQGLLTLMDDGDDEISFGEFIAGVMRVKVAGKGADLATLLLENKKVLKRVLGVRSVVDRLEHQLNPGDTQDYEEIKDGYADAPPKLVRSNTRLVTT